ncbi:MAG: hypothetical protein HRT53_01715 [Colwellia sp.]|nr:hypothetical protein [Colwellia sp.]
MNSMVPQRIFYLHYLSLEIIVFINNQTGAVAKHLYDKLTGIQHGNREDKFGWIESVE